MCQNDMKKMHFTGQDNRTDNSSEYVQEILSDVANQLQKCNSRIEGTQYDIQVSFEYLDTTMQELSMQLWDIFEAVNEMTDCRKTENEKKTDENEETYLGHMLWSIDIRLKRLENKLRFLDGINDIRSLPGTNGTNVLPDIDEDLKNNEHRNSEDDLPF